MWRKGICHHEWLLDYEGFAIKLDNVNEDDIVELDWRDLVDSEDLQEYLEIL